MIKEKVKRLWHSFASVRNYRVQEAIAKKDSLLITFGEETMEIPYEKLKEGKENDFDIISKHDGKIYRLVDFKWKADDNKQPKLFQ